MGRKNRTFREVAYSTIKEDTNLIDAIDILKDDDPSLVEERLQILLEKNIEGKPNVLKTLKQEFVLKISINFY
jgi:hypothetical protein